LSDRMTREREKSCAHGGAPAAQAGVLEAEDLARTMIRQARGKAEDLTRKAGQLEEQYRRRREELAEECRVKRQACDDEIAAMKAREEQDLEALRADARERAHAQGIEQGFQEGFLRGRADGLAEGREEGRRRAHEDVMQTLGAELSAAAAALAALVKEIDARRAAALDGAERDVLALALAIAEKIVKREIRLAPEVVLGNVRKALEIVAQRDGARIEANPEDVALIERHAAGALDVFRESPSLAVVPNARVARGGCIVTSGGAGADLQIETQLAVIERALAGETDGTIRA